MISITLGIQTDDSTIVARGLVELARAAAGLALELGFDESVSVTVLRFDPDSDDNG